jgi:haloacid dehalogenase-like hydrolase
VFFLALVTDYDGTLAHDGVVDPDTIAALGRLKNSGRRRILVTSRELPDRAFPELGCCDPIVAENGALLYESGTRRDAMLDLRLGAATGKARGKSGDQSDPRAVPRQAVSPRPAPCATPKRAGGIRPTLRS